MEANTTLYHPLSHPSAIRLVLLGPGEPEDTKVVCRLLQPNESPPNLQYEALSYMWGNANHTTNIVLNGVSYPATVNLVSALRHLRHSDSNRTLWIDALCINQKDIPERNVQVGRMTEIYRSAQRTLVFLGEWTACRVGGGSDPAPGEMQDFLESAIELSGKGTLFWENLTENDLNSWVRAIWLLASSWFNRVWVL
ncbi:heterokaryon incompatibility protein-domain-containing protein [Podospora australis]|uniref:Heterokaryon incompatibility protein-domain-containing protein n=1 Tax=Podospora australis TaxID=1536484 RepID=A0AAN7AFD2_9PEZI|nr:heterokaryon incompatibility protein-domain-containing protein [Podospora australis]